MYGNWYVLYIHQKFYVINYIIYFQIMPPRPNFQEKWLSDDNFKLWLGRVPGSSTKVMCSFCQKTLSAEKTSLKRHRLSKQHISMEAWHLRNNEARRSAEEGEADHDVNEDQRRQNAVSYATLLFLVFIAQHNLPFR